MFGKRLSGITFFSLSHRCIYLATSRVAIIYPRYWVTLCLSILLLSRRKIVFLPWRCVWLTSCMRMFWSHFRFYQIPGTCWWFCRPARTSHTFSLLWDLTATQFPSLLSTGLFLSCLSCYWLHPFMASTTPLCPSFLCCQNSSVESSTGRWGLWEVLPVRGLCSHERDFHPYGKKGPNDCFTSVASGEVVRYTLPPCLQGIKIKKAQVKHLYFLWRKTWKPNPILEVFSV